MTLESVGMDANLSAKSMPHVVSIVYSDQSKAEDPGPHDIFHMTLQQLGHFPSPTTLTAAHHAGNCARKLSTAPLPLLSCPIVFVELKKLLEYLTFFYEKNDDTLAQPIHFYSGKDACSMACM